MPIVSAITSAIDAALNKAYDMYQEAKEKGCKPDWDKIIEAALMAALEGAIKGLISGGFGAIGAKLIGKLNLCDKFGKLMGKAICPGVQFVTDTVVGVGSGMLADEFTGAFTSDNCFVAGTQVWLLKEGRDPATASQAVSQGDAIENWAEQKDIEDVKVGDWALTRDEAAFAGATHVSPALATKSLCFGYVSETYQNTTDELISLTLFDTQTSATETLEVTPGHPFWVSDTGSSSGEVGTWTFASDLAEGDELTSVTGHAPTVTAVKPTKRHAHTFNFAVSVAHTYFIGSTTTWVHNASVYHPNDIRSRKSNLVYEIYDTRKGETYKYGISSKGKNTAGQSIRAEDQVRALNSKRGNAGRYESRIVEEGIKRRSTALNKEQELVNRFARNNPKGFKGPRGNIRPKAKKC